jgi:hypothetical protein
MGYTCCFTDQQDLIAAMRSGPRTGRTSLIRFTSVTAGLLTE